MQFDPHAIIINRDTGQALLDEARPVTLGFVVVRALDAKYRDDDSVAPSVLFERYRLASRIRKAAPDRGHRPQHRRSQADQGHRAQDVRARHLRPDLGRAGGEHRRVEHRRQPNLRELR